MITTTHAKGKHNGQYWFTTHKCRVTRKERIGELSEFSYYVWERIEVNSNSKFLKN